MDQETIYLVGEEITGASDKIFGGYKDHQEAVELRNRLTKAYPNKTFFVQPVELYRYGNIPHEVWVMLYGDD